MAGSILAGTASVSLNADISQYEQQLAKARKTWIDFTKGLSPTSNLSVRGFVSIENSIKAMDKSLQKMWSSSADSSKKTLASVKEIGQVLSRFKTDSKLSSSVLEASSSYKSLTSSIKLSNIALAQNLSIVRQIQSAYRGIPRTFMRSHTYGASSGGGQPYVQRTFDPSVHESSYTNALARQQQIFASKKASFDTQRQADISAYNTKLPALSMADAQKSMSVQKSLASQEIRALRDKYREISSITRDYLYKHKDDATYAYKERIRNELRLAREETQRAVSAITEGYRQRREAIQRGIDSIKKQAGSKVGLFRPIVGRTEYTSAITGSRTGLDQSLQSNQGTILALKKDLDALQKNMPSMKRSEFDEQLRRANISLKQAFSERIRIIREAAAQQKEALQRYSQMNRGAHPTERFQMQEDMRRIRAEERANLRATALERQSMMQQSKDLSAGRHLQDPSTFGKYIQTAISIVLLREAIQSFKSLVTLAGQFSKEMAIVGARSSSTNNELRALTQTARDLAQTTIFTATEIAGAMSEMAGSGMKAKAIIASIADVSNLALATGSTLQTAADIVIQIERVYGISADKTGTVVDMLTTAANESNMTLEELNSSLKYSLATGEQASQSLGSLLKIQMALSNAGLKGSIGGTGHRRLNTLISSKAAEISAVFKVDTSDAYGRLRELSDIMGDIGKKARGMSEVERGAAFKDVFDIWGASTAAVLMKTNFDEIDAAFDKGAESAAIAGSRIKESFGAQLELARASWQALQLALSENIIPVITVSLDALKDVMSAIATVSKTVTRALFSTSDGLVAADKSTQDLNKRWGPLKYITTYLGKSLSYIAIGLTAVAIGFKVAAAAAWLFNAALAALKSNVAVLAISLAIIGISALYTTMAKASDQTGKFNAKIAEAERNIKKASKAREELMNGKQDEAIAAITQLNEELGTTVNKLDEIQQKWKDAFKDPKQKNIEEIQAQIAEVNKEFGAALAKQSQQNAAAQGEKESIYARHEGWKDFDATGTPTKAKKDLFDKITNKETGLIDPEKLKQVRLLNLLGSSLTLAETSPDAESMFERLSREAGFEKVDFSRKEYEDKKTEYGFTSDDVLEFYRITESMSKTTGRNFFAMLADKNKTLGAELAKQSPLVGTTDKIEKSIGSQRAKDNEEFTPIKSKKEFFDKIKNEETGLIDQEKLKQIRLLELLSVSLDAAENDPMQKWGLTEPKGPPLSHDQRLQSFEGIRKTAGFEETEFSQKGLEDKKTEFGFTDEDIREFSNIIADLSTTTGLDRLSLVTGESGAFGKAWNAAFGSGEVSDEIMSAYTLAMKQNLETYTEYSSKIEGITKDLDTISKMEQETEKNDKTVAELTAKRAELTAQITEQLQKQFEKNAVGLKDQDVAKAVNQSPEEFTTDPAMQQYTAIKDSIITTKKFEAAQKTVRSMYDQDDKLGKDFSTGLSEWERLYQEKPAEAEATYAEKAKPIENKVLSESRIKEIQDSIVSTQTQLLKEQNNLATLQATPTKAGDTKQEEALASSKSTVAMLTSKLEKLTTVYGQQALNAAKFQEASKTLDELSAGEIKKQETIAGAAIAEKDMRLAELEVGAKFSGNKETLRYIERSREENKIEAGINRKGDLLVQLVAAEAKKEKFDAANDKVGSDAAQASIVTLRKSITEVTVDIAESAEKLRESIIKGSKVDANRNQVTATGGWAAFFSYKPRYEDQVTSYLSHIERLIKLQNDKMPPKDLL